jgi:hypothetical protein
MAAVQLNPIEKIKIIAQVANEMAADGCVFAMVQSFKEANYSDEMTVFGLKALVRHDIFDEIAANVFGEFVPEVGNFFDNDIESLFASQMDEAFRRVFPRFMRRIVH